MNFSIFQTPFSAQLSIKKSFSKNFHGNSERELVEVLEDQDKSDVWKDIIKELENRLTAVNVENVMLKRTIEEHEHSLQNLEIKCKNLDENFKVEKKKNKKERQKEERRAAEENVSKIKVEKIESEEHSVDVDVPTSNKFVTLANVNSDDLKEQTKGIEKKDWGSQTDGIECQICSEFLPLEIILNDHIAKNQTETTDSSAQTFTATTFEQYSCFYCGISITSESCLTNHVDKCHGKFKGNSVNDQPIHSQMIAMQRMLSAMQTPKVKCDICYKEFVQLHKMSEHDSKFAFLKQDRN